MSNTNHPAEWQEAMIRWPEIAEPTPTAFEKNTKVIHRFQRDAFIQGAEWQRDQDKAIIDAWFESSTQAMRDVLTPDEVEIFTRAKTAITKALTQ